MYICKYMFFTHTYMHYKSQTLGGHKQKLVYIRTQEKGAVIQDHYQEKERQKGKMVVRGGLTNSWEKKRSKRQRRNLTIWIQSSKLARKDKKTFLSDQCKEIEENNRMGKTRYLFKKMRDTKGTSHAKIGTMKTERYGPNRSRRY